MIRVTVGNADRQFDGDVDEQWINQQIVRQRKASGSVCVRIHVEKGDIRLTLSSPECPAGGGGRPPSERERAIIALWDECGLNQSGFAPGRAVEFLKRLRHLL